MVKFQKMLKKTVSFVVVLCFMVSIANLPAFAYETFENSGTTDAVLAQPFYTPAQLATQTTAENTVKETTSAKTKSTKKTSTAKPKATTKKASTKKAKVTTAKVKKIANQSISLINKLLKKKGTSKLAKTWLKKAKASINSMLKSKKSNATKYTWLNKALTSIKAISKAKASDLSLVQQTVKSGSVFSYFKTVLKKNATYKIYANYTAKIVSSINKLVKKTGISEVAKQWLNKANTLVNNMMFGKKSNSAKKTWLKKALTSINNVVKKNASNEVLRQESGKGKVFASLSNLIPTDNTNSESNPNDPVNPVNPVTPDDPVNPSDPVDPVNPDNPVDPTPVEKPYQQNLDASTSLINNLKNNENISNLAKSWLDAAQTTINEIANSDKTDAEKEELIANALASIQNVSNNNCSMEVLEQESASGVFGSLQSTVLENNTEYQNYQINNTYSTENVEVINSLTATSGLSKYQVFQQFKNAGVTNEKFAEVAATLSDKISKGETFVNTSAVALSKYLKIDEKLAAVQQLAVAIANGSNINNNLSGSNNSISLQDQLAVVKLNGDNVADKYNYSIDYFMETLKNGESAVVYTNPSRTIMVTKENENSYEIIDYGYKINGKAARGICNAEEFKKIMNGKSVSIPFHIDPSFGFSYSTNWNVWYNNSDGKLNFISNSKGIKEKEEEKLNTEYVEPAISLINNLLTAEGTSDLAKIWLNKAKEVVNGIINDNNNVSNEEVQLKAVLASVERVVEQNASIAILVQESSQGSAFASLQEEVLNKDDNVKNVISPIFEQYAKPVVSAINSLLKNNNDLSESAQVWLNAALNLTGAVMNEIVTATNEGRDCSQQKQWLQQALASIETVRDENASIEVLIQETSNGGTFAQLQETLENTTTYQAYQKYEKIGVNVIRALAKYINVLESVVFQQFERFNVTLDSLTAQIGRDNLNVGGLLLDQIQKGTNLFNCVSLAMSKYLDISRTFAGLQNLSADIALGWYSYFNSNEYTLISTSDAAELKVLKENGIEATNYNFVFSLDNFISNFKIGGKALFNVNCFGSGGHTILVSREAQDSFGVCDVNLNGGNKVIYTISEFEQLMNGQGSSITGKDAVTGEDVTREIYYKATNGSDKVSFIAVSENVQDMLQMAA